MKPPVPETPALPEGHPAIAIGTGPRVLCTEHPDTGALRECRAELESKTRESFSWESEYRGIEDKMKEQDDALDSARADLATARDARERLDQDWKRRATDSNVALETRIAQAVLPLEGYMMSLPAHGRPWPITSALAILRGERT